MRSFAKFLILAPLTVLVAVLALANRTPVTLSLDPFRPESPALSLSLPLFVVIFVTLMLGVLLGGVATWLNQGKWRRAARRRRYELTKLQEEAARRPPEIATSSLPRPLG